MRKKERERARDRQTDREKEDKKVNSLEVSLRFALSLALTVEGYSQRPLRALSLHSPLDLWRNFSSSRVGSLLILALIAILERGSFKFDWLRIRISYD